MTAPIPRSAQRYKGRVVRIDDVMADTRVLTVELENQQRMAFNAGQYVLLHVPGLEPRPFSIAAAPQQPALEFHIRNSGYGVSAYVMQEMSPGAQIVVEGPFGVSHWQPSPRPLIALAGGLGIAPLKSILEAHFAQAGAAPATLYWGVRNQEQLYLDHLFRDMARRHAAFSYIPVLSDAGDDTVYRTGFPVTALVEDKPALQGLNIFVAGPPAMTAATLPVLLDHQAEPDAVFSDAWNP